MRIDRCVCEGKPFGELLAVARAHDLELRELAEREGCGTHCGWCVAYLRRALATGEVVFREIMPKESL
jgi:bacterioferritin-associated ferredoxin